MRKWVDEKIVSHAAGEAVSFRSYLVKAGLLKVPALKGATPRQRRMTGAQPETIPTLELPVRRDYLHGVGCARDIPR